VEVTDAVLVPVAVEPVSVAVADDDPVRMVLPLFVAVAVESDPEELPEREDLAPLIQL
jgi:hypothetical protein